MSEPHTLTVSVAHTDLRRARYPLAVGHYAGDVIVSAEAALDAALGGALRQHFDVGRYPGDVDTYKIVLQPGSRPPGAIVVGLGKVGELTPKRLREVLAGALKDYALRLLQEPHRDDDASPIAANCSVVLIGTDGGGFGSVPDSVHAVVCAALDANKALRNAHVFDRVRIDAIEFVELFEDMAIRAAHVVAELPGPLEQEFQAEDVVRGQPSMSVYQGGRFLRPTSPYAVGWWQRIAVRRRPPDAGSTAPPASDSSTALVFSVPTDRARVEQDVSVLQRTLVQQLIAKAIGQADADPDVPAGLFQLLVPERVKGRIRAGGDLLFVVDRAGAGYPFELMADRGPEGIKFLAEDRGILRQFETDEFDSARELAKANRIFILGNPKTIFWRDLPAAEIEAIEVAKVAAQCNLEVFQAPRDEPVGTAAKLLTGEYRILHLAAHGQFDPDPSKSGVILGAQQLITPGEVAKMLLVPEFVFLNCCYLGVMDAARASNPDPRVAASLAEGFIRAGVRAVIAAGWTVDDHAGLTFAREFYDRFLNGAPFGQAVKEARDATRKAHPLVNTWGAYQCYGNPEYRFRQDAAAPSHAPTFEIVARSEALQTLRTMVGDARRVRFDNVQGLADQFDVLYKALGDRWRDGEVLHACGEICGELGKFDRAIDFYRRALKAEPANAPFIAAEQLANLLAREAAVRPVEEEKQRTSDFAEALKWLDWLDRRMGPSKERWALRGSTYKRMAICTQEGRRDLLKRAARAYGEAKKLANKASYGALNALALEFVLASKRSVGKLKREADEYWTAAQAGSAGAGDRDFWSFVGYADALLHKHVVHGTFDGSDAIETLCADYARARQVGPSAREWASVRDHIAFLAAMTADPSLPCCSEVTAKGLNTVLASMGP